MGGGFVFAQTSNYEKMKLCKKTFKRFLALLMTVMLIFSVVPTTVFAAEVPPETESAASSEALQEPEPTPSPEVMLEPSEEPSQEPAPTSAPETAETVKPSPTPDPSAEPEDTELTPGTELDMNRIWPALRRAQARAAANIGTSGTLYVGDYCFTSAVGVPPTLGEHIGLLPVETMKFGSNNVAAYCLEHSKESGDGMGYTWMDLTINNQDTVGTILALGFQWNSPLNWAVPSDDSDKWIVTQVLIWEAIANHAFKQGNGLYGVESGVDTDMQMINPRP